MLKMLYNEKKEILFLKIKPNLRSMNFVLVTEIKLSTFHKVKVIKFLAYTWNKVVENKPMRVVKSRLRPK